MTDREINAAIAEHIMGWVWVQHSPQQTQLEGYQGENPRWLADPKWIKGLGDDPSWVIVPANMDAPIHVSLDILHFSTDISATWQVVSELQQHGLHFSIESTVRGSLEDLRTKTKHYQWHVSVRGAKAEAREDTAALAICLAALRAVGVEVTQ